MPGYMELFLGCRRALGHNVARLLVVCPGSWTRMFGTKWAFFYWTSSWSWSWSSSSSSTYINNMLKLIEKIKKKVAKKLQKNCKKKLTKKKKVGVVIKPITNWTKAINHSSNKSIMSSETSFTKSDLKQLGYC